MVGQLYQEPGLARKVRLSKDYIHANSCTFGKKGLRCILCHYILKDDISTSTTKGCVTCCVPLCSATSYKFNNPEESCEYRWHNIVDLKSLSPTKKNTKKRKMTIAESVQAAGEALLNMARPRKTARRRRR